MSSFRRVNRKSPVNANSGSEQRADGNVGAGSINASYDTLHGSDHQTATHYEHLRHPYESLRLQQTPSETHGIISEIKEADYVNVNDTYEEIIE